MKYNYDCLFLVEVHYCGETATSSLLLDSHFSLLYRPLLCVSANV